MLFPVDEVPGLIIAGLQPGANMLLNPRSGGNGFHSGVSLFFGAHAFVLEKFSPEASMAYSSLGAVINAILTND